MRTIHGSREKVTVYFTSELSGRVVRREGRLVRVDDYTQPGRAHRGADVVIVRKGGRSEERISSSFWVVVDGWGHPDPGGPTDDGQGDGADGRYRHASHDPAWVGEFLRGIGTRLSSRFMLAGGALSERRD